MLEVNQTMQLSGGTYTILGSKAILKYGLSGVPDYIGRDLELDFSIEGDTMIIRGTQPDGSTTEETTCIDLGIPTGVSNFDAPQSTVSWTTIRSGLT